MHRRASLVLVLLLLAAPARAADPAVEEVRRCAEKNLPAKTARQEVVFVSTDASGGSQTLEAQVLWRRTPESHSEVLVRVERPADVRGSAFLMLEREGGYDLFSYLPELQKVRRLTGSAISGSLFGTDFSYEDFVRLQDAVGGSGAERLPDAEVDGRAAYVIAATPAADAGSAYQRVVTFLDKQWCVPLRADLESAPGRLAKQLVVDAAQVKQVGERWIPHRVRLDDAEKSTHTTLTIEKVDLDVPLKESAFSESGLVRGR
jgi:hypothetical protein